MKGLQTLLNELRTSQQVSDQMKETVDSRLLQQLYLGEAMAFKEAADKLEKELKDFLCVQREIFEIRSLELLNAVKKIIPPQLPDEEEEAQEEGEEYFTVSQEEAEYAYKRCICKYPLGIASVFGSEDYPYPMWLKREILTLRSKLESIREKS